MKFNIITIFPTFFESFKNEALISRAQKKKLISIATHNLRDYADDKRGTVDGRPYGGGAGMVLLFSPIYKAVKKIKARIKNTRKTKVIVFNPKGKKFTQEMARSWSKLDRLIMICGRYEGIDERVMTEVADEEISIGDYVLFGGEVPAMVVMEAVTRLIPGVLGNTESLKEETFNSKSEIRNSKSETNQKSEILKIKNLKLKILAEHPHYTRPEVIKIKNKKLKVPAVLLSGDHKKIEEWRKSKSKQSNIFKYDRKHPSKLGGV